jgi:aryl-alcohol dehydrogenase-like predicted oxidoreductase
VIERAAFGRTGHVSSRVVFGGAALGRVDQAQADEVLDVLLEHGVNHLDTAASYGDSELRIGPWMAAHRDRFFLATKTGERTGDGARASLERSLQRLQVDAVDLVQLHNLVEPDEWEVAFGPHGAVAALERARDEGLVRAVGVTGHGTRIARVHRRSLERHPFDSVLLPYSFAALQDPAYRADVDALLATCADRGVAVQTIKSVARRRWAPDHEGPRRSWYEPIDDDGAAGRSVRWVLGHPQLFVNTSSDLGRLRTMLEAAAGAGAPPPTDDEVRADGERLGIRPLFDGADLERI